MTTQICTVFACTCTALDALAHICCAQDAYERVCLDLERAKQEGYIFAAKLVRGAYMYLERTRAKEHGYESPVWPDKEHTDANYNRWMHRTAVPVLLSHLAVTDSLAVACCVKLCESCTCLAYLQEVGKPALPAMERALRW